MSPEHQAEHARLVAHAEAAIDRLVPRADARPARLHTAMRHALAAGGKRLRPVLCLATAKALDPGADASAAAVALECVHTYSLIHDDLPCMDDSDLRRGRPTVHKAFDEATALLAGDALLALAFQLTATYPGETARELTAALAAAAGSAQLVGGQMEDILGLSAPVTAERLDFIQRGKTAAMLSASLAMGAIVGGAAPAARTHLAAAGAQLGVAFQIADDLLDLEGDPAVVGKPTGADPANGKLTYPGLHGVAAARAAVVRLSESAIAEIDAARLPAGSVGFLKALVLSLVDRRR